VDRIATVGRILITTGKLVAVVWAGYVVLWVVTAIQDSVHIAQASSAAPTFLSGLAVGLLCTSLFRRRGVLAAIPLSWIAPTLAWFWRGVRVVSSEYKIVHGQLVLVRDWAPAYEHLLTMLVSVTIGSAVASILWWRAGRRQ